MISSCIRCIRQLPWRLHACSPSMLQTGCGKSFGIVVHDEDFGLKPGCASFKDRGERV